MKLFKKTVIALLVCAVATVSGARAQGVAQTKHNLSVSGPGDPLSRVCVFCHTPHNANPATPLWNRSLPELRYTPYSSSTLGSSPGQPTHASRLCLSCHDGTIALGKVLQADTPPTMGSVMTGSANLSQNLSDDHPISFVYDGNLAAQNQELNSPSVLSGGPVHLDAYGQLQCTTCHDPHYSPYPDFLVRDNQFSALCTTCHAKRGWGASAHATSGASWNGSGLDPWPNTTWTSVAGNACESCHTPHAAGSGQRLLNYAREEDNCLVCHNGNVATKNIEQDLSKPYRHDVGLFEGIHDPTEDALTMSRHVECQDCHDPHAANTSNAAAPYASGALAEVSGVSDAGAPVSSVMYEYEVCLKCHGDGPNVPAPNIQRLVFQPNIRLKFQSSNPSMHPVMAPGRNNDVPSLINPWTENSVMYCTDCHASDSGPGAGGNGPAGPHGSNWPYLLEREYRTADNTKESYQAYEMCYKCHSRTSILNDVTFDDHKKHIEGEDTPCSVCHDPHGISVTQGDATSNSHLINFDTSIVSPDPRSGRLEFVDLGSRRGACYLECHGKRHSPKRYGGGM